MKKVGLMGGTFNPIHYGHLHIADTAYKEYQLDEVWFLPNHIPAYKEQSMLIDVKDRLHMISLAIQDYAYFSLNTMEIDRGGRTYTAETLQILTREFPDYEFYFIMGADSLDSFLKWYQPGVILKHAKILVATRKDVDTTELAGLIKYTEAMLKTSDRLHLLHCEKLWRTKDSTDLDTTWITSSQIREALHMSQDTVLEHNLRLQEIMPDSVYDYIRERGLYG